MVICQPPLSTGEEIAFENGRISDFQGLVTLTLALDRVILHTVVHHSSTSTYTPNFIEIEENFCGRTDVQTYRRTGGHLKPTVLGRLGEVDLKRSANSNLRPQIYVSCCWEAMWIWLRRLCIWWPRSITPALAERLLLLLVCVCEQLPDANSSPIVTKLGQSYPWPQGTRWLNFGRSRSKVKSVGEVCALLNALLVLFCVWRR